MEEKNVSLGTDEDFSLISVHDSGAVGEALESISKPLSDFLNFHGLPTNNVLAQNKEKVKLFNSFNDAIECLPKKYREDAKYLTKFVVAAAGGLFDGALSFLWDEAVKSIRRAIVLYDLTYFYSVAEQVNSRYKNLSSEEDLEYISDHDLLDVSRRIGLIDDYGFQVLENINYLRNHASSAHPNENEITGIKLLSLLEDCIKYAILIEPDCSVLQIKQLFENLRNHEIPSGDFDIIAKELMTQPQVRIDDFLSSIFGLYCADGKNPFVYTNIENISSRIWDNSSEETKYVIGSKYGYYLKNGDINKKTKINQFLERVGGLKYKDEESIVTELIEKLQQLRFVHFGMNNFYNEYSYARDIDQIMPRKGVPEAVKQMFIKTICVCYAGNGCGYREGVDESAIVIYKKFINKFDNEDIKKIVLLFQDAEFAVDFNKAKPDKRIRELCYQLKSQATNNDVLSALDIILRHPNGRLNQITLSDDYQAIILKLQK